VGGNGFGTRTFWAVAIPNSAVFFDAASETAVLHVRDLAVNDSTNIPVSLGPNWQTAFVPATVSIDITWSGQVTRRVRITDGTNGDHFAGDFAEQPVMVRWSAETATGFRFRSEPGTFATSLPGQFFAEVGRERNGSFFPADLGGGEPELLSVAPIAIRDLSASRTAVDAVGLARVLGGTWSTPAPSEATFLLSPEPAETLGASPVGNLESNWRVAPPDLDIGATHPQVLDEVFAMPEGITPGDALRADTAFAWAF
jgi:hypothetical protein